MSRDSRRSVRVTTAAEAAAADAAAIAGGTPSRALMQRAGAAAAAEVVRRYGRRLARGVAVHAGPGNNGGDAWVVAAALARYGVRVGVREWAGPARTDDARFERERALGGSGVGAVTGREAVVVDGLFGTGARATDPALLDAYAHELGAARSAGARVVALDVPSGLDATTGDPLGAVSAADLTLTFGTLKRGLLVARGLAGVIAVLDIGLAPEHEPADAPALFDAPDVEHVVTAAIAADAHKGTRGKVAVVGGAPGMAGAAALATVAALRSGAGMVRAVVAPASVAAVQYTVPAALASAWPTDDDALRTTVLDWADAVLIGPGLGQGGEAVELLARVLRLWRGPVVLDADALNHFAGRANALAPLLAGRPALLTPHPLECARLMALDLDHVLAGRFTVGGELARRAGAVVLLKGVPTVVSDGTSHLIVARGTPALGTGGSGDVLGGVAAALLAARMSGRATGALHAGAAAAWVHGRAGEIATARRGGVRGTTLDDVLAALSDAWPRTATVPNTGRAPYPVLAELPRVPG